MSATAEGAQSALASEYVEVMEALRAEHKEHDVLEAKASRASRASYASYEKLKDLRERSRQLREAYAALTGEELDGEIAKLEDRGGGRPVEVVEKKEDRLLVRTPRTARPLFSWPGSTEVKR